MGRHVPARSVISNSVVFALAGAILCGGGFSMSSALADATKKKPSIFFYHDGRHPLIYMYEPPMQKEEYEAAIDELAGTPVEAILFALGDGRTVLHDTKIGELWGHNNTQWTHIIFRRAFQNAVHLIRSGHDPLRVVCERAHAKGMVVYPTLLVNQGTGVRGKDMRTSLFRLDNPHLEIGADGGLPNDFPAPKNLDFKHKEVRDERMALIQETLTRYDVDGFELQMLYVPYYFRPDEVKAGREILTDWIGDVYRAVKESGEDRELVIRIPSSIEACEAVGMDVREWVRRGIVDVLIGVNFITPSILNHTLNLKALVDATRGSKTRVVASLYSEVHSDRRMDASTEMIRAGACNYWAQGIDGLMLDKFFVYWPYEAHFYEKLREIPHPEVMAPKDKTYFVPTHTNMDHIKPRIDVGLKAPLPRDLHVNKPITVQLPISDDLAHWDKVGRVHKVLLRVRLTSAVETDRVDIKLNGKPLPSNRLRRINNVYKMRSPRYRVFGYWYVYDLDREHWPIRGTNDIEVTATHRDSDIVAQLQLRDVELDVKYLMGRNFHRRDDTELGTSDVSTY